MTTPPDDLERLWKSQDVPKTEHDMQTLTIEATKFQSRIKRRNAGEYIAGLFVAVCFGAQALGDDPLLVRAGALLVVIGTAVAVVNIRLRGHAAKEPPPMHGPTTDVVAWHRAELARQRDLLRDVPRWYVGPLLPGVVLLVGGMVASKPDRWLGFLAPIAVIIMILAFVLWLNRRGARKLDEQIAKLED